MANIVPGQTVGAYRILNQIGEGGMAAVYRAHHAAMDRYVAVKVLPSEFAKSETFRARFQQEARLVANLEHPHILPVHDFGESDGIHYFVMRFLEAGTLASRIEAKPLSLADIDRIFTQVASALAYAHQRGVVHRDMKPSNVLIDSRGDAFLTDFGIAKLLEGTSKFTTTGAITGTPAYMSPEQAQGEKLDLRSDIYSLGIVLYEMVTGRVPFDAETPLAVMFKHLNAPLPPPSSIKPDVHPEIERVLLKSLAKNREERYSTVDEFIAAWKKAVHLAQIEPPTVAGSPAIAPKPVPAPGRKVSMPVLLAIIGVVAAGCLLVAIPLGGFALFRLAGTQLSPSGTEASFVTLRPGETALPGQTVVPVANITPIASLPEDGNWTSWTDGNGIITVETGGEYVFTGTRGSLVAWNRLDGTLFKQYTTADGLPAPRVNAVYAGGDESIWVGTENGLINSNGTDVRLFNEDDGLDSEAISSITFIDGTPVVGTLYSGQDGGGLNVLDNGTWQHIDGFPSADNSVNPDALSYNISALLYDGELLWVGTDNGLASYDGSNWEVYTTAEGLPNNQIYVLSQDPENGDILIGTDDGGVIYDGESFFIIPTGPTDAVYGIVTRGDGDYWLSGGGGLWRYNRESGDTENWDVNNSAIPSYNLYESTVAEDGTIFVGSDYGLLAFQDAPDFELWQLPNVPTDGSFDGILTEPNGNLWAQGRYGSSIDLFDVASEQWVDGWAMGDRPGYPLLIEPDGTIWANDGTSVLRVYGADGSETEIGEAQGMPAEAFVYAVRLAPDGTAWLVTSNGLLATDGLTITQVINDDETGLGSNDMRAVHAASDGSLWVASGKPGLSRRLPDGTWQVYGLDNPFERDDVYIHDIVEDAYGSIWVGTDNWGVYRYDTNGAWTQYYNELPSVGILSLYIAPDTSVWAGTTNGAARFDGVNWQSIEPSKEGLTSGFVYDVYVAPNGDVYFATGGGMSRYRP